MKKLLLILFTVVSVSVQAQHGWIKPNNSKGTISNGLSVDTALFIPTGCGAPTKVMDLPKSALYGDSCNNILYKYNPKDSSWTEIGNASDSNAYRSSVQLTDTSYKANKTKGGTVYLFEGGVGSGGGINSVQAGTGITVDNTDPSNPIVNAVNSAVTVSNGLTKVGSDIQLGGALTGNTIISQPQSGFGLTLTGSPYNSLTITNTNANGAAINASSSFIPATFTRTEATTFQRAVARLNFNPSSGAGAAGIGAGLEFGSLLTDGTPSTVGSIYAIFTDATPTNYTTQLKFYTAAGGPSGGSFTAKLLINGVGSIQLPKYGAGTFTGTPAKQLSVDASGNVIETTQPIITTGTAAPTSTPAKAGDIYIDTSAKKLYFAAGNSSSSDWIIAN